MRQAAALAQLTGRTEGGLLLMGKVNSIFPLLFLLTRENKIVSRRINYSVSGRM